MALGGGGRGWRFPLHGHPSGSINLSARLFDAAVCDWVEDGGVGNGPVADRWRHRAAAPGKRPANLKAFPFLRVRMK